MKYFSQYADENWEVAKSSCLHGKGFDSINEAVEVTKLENDHTSVPFVVKDENGVQVWPSAQTDAFELLMEVVQLSRSGKSYKELLPILKEALKKDRAASDMCNVLIKNLGG